MENSKKTEFTVVLDGIQLPEDVHNLIRMELQDVVMRNVAKIDIPRKLPTSVAIFRKHWYGIYARKIGREIINKEIENENLKGLSYIVEEDLRR